MTAENTPSALTPDTILLIHGLWMTPRSWEKWVEHYEEKGYRVLAPANRHRAVGFTKEQFHYAFANTLSEEDSQKVYERYHIPAPGSFIWAAVLANFEPGHQDGYVNYNDDERVALLLIAGGEDHLQPAAVNESNFKHYRRSSATTDYHEFPGRSHYTVGQDGWEEVADYALEWAVEHANRPVA